MEVGLCRISIANRRWGSGMSRKACLAIGVGDAPPLTYLGGAVTGAETLGSWALQAGYVTTVLTDRRDPVRLLDVETALANLLPDNEPTDRLIISFAGHGLQRGLEDLWLLSKWLPEDEAISVAAMRLFLERYNLRQLVIVSDACRKAAATPETAALTAHPGLRRGRIAARRLHTDMLRATSSYTAAFMLRGRTEAGDRCLFSTLLFEALSGAVDDAFMERDGRRSLFSDSLATWLETAVPERAGRYGLTLVPEIDPGLRFPDDIYVEAPPVEKPTLPPWPDPADIAPVQLDSREDGAARVPPPPGCSWSSRIDPERPDQDDGFEMYFGDHGGQMTADGDFAMATELRSAREPVDLGSLIRLDRERADRRRADAERVEIEVHRDFSEQDRPTHFETRAGFALAGARAQRAWLGPAARAQDVKDGAWWRIEPARPGLPFWSSDSRLETPLPLLVELDHGRWAGAAAMPGFITTFGVDSSGVTSLVCRQMEELDARPSEAAIAYLAAGTLTEKQLSKLIVGMRERKHQDPVLGVLACYLHDRAGDIDNIRRTAFYFANSGQPIPFDIALLARLTAHRGPEGLLYVAIPPVDEARDRPQRAALPDYMRAATPHATGLVAGAFPWLREGWALLDPEGEPELYSAGLARLATQILPALFTTLTPDGGEQLAHLLSHPLETGHTPGMPES